MNKSKEMAFSPIAETCISTVNYLFLRAVTTKEYFSESVLDELSMYVDEIANAINENQSDVLKEVSVIIRKELEDGPYLDDFEFFQNQLSVLCPDYRQVKDFYIEIARDILERDVEESREV